MSEQSTNSDQRNAKPEGRWPILQEFFNQLDRNYPDDPQVQDFLRKVRTW